MTQLSSAVRGVLFRLAVLKLTKAYAKKCEVDPRTVLREFRVALAQLTEADVMAADPATDEPGS